MKAYSKLIKTDWLGAKFDKGWGNGYVVLPKEHPFHGYDYDFINGFVNVHGGLTYASSEDNGHGGWCIGFDTMHYDDTIEKWSYEAVKEETLRLLEQMVKIGKEYTKEVLQQMLKEDCEENSLGYSPE